MKKLFATLALVFFTAACTEQGGSMQSGMMEGMQCKCCQEMMKDGCKCCEAMMKEGKECCCKDMMSASGMMDMDKKNGKMQCPMMKKDNAGKENSVSKPATKTAPDEHEQHH